MKSKIILTAAVLAAMAGGYQGFAATSVDGDTMHVSGSETIDYNQLTTGNKGVNNYQGTGLDSSLTITTDTPLPGKDDKKNGILMAQMGENKKFSDLGSFSMSTSLAKGEIEAYTQMGTILATSGGSIAFDNIDNINLGSADQYWLSAGPTVQAASANISFTNINNFNVYSQNHAIMAQQFNTSDGGQVKIQANNINVYSHDNAVSAMIYKDGSQAKTPVSVDMDAADSVHIESTGEGLDFSTVSGLEIGSSSIYNGGKDVPGKVSVNINAVNDITILGGSKNEDSEGHGIYVHHAYDGNLNLNIASEQGDVNIEGNYVGLWSSNTEGKECTIDSTISGKNVNISADERHGIYLLGSHNTLNLEGDNITVSGGYFDDGSNAISVSKNGTLNMKGMHDGSVITVNSLRDGGNAISAVSGGQVTLGDGRSKTDVNINGYVNISGENSNLTFADKTTTHVDGKYLTGEKFFITTGGTGTVTFGEDAKLDIGNVGADTTLKLIDDENSLKNFTADMITTDNVLQEFTINKDGTITASTVGKEDAAKLLGGSVLTNVALAATGDAKYADVKALVDGANAKEALDSAAGLAAMANTAHGTYTMNGIFSDAVSGHLMNRQDQDVWAYGFHSKENVNGLSFGADYDAQYNGIAAGADFYKKGGTTAGLALIYADSNVSGSNGFATTKNDADYYGVSLYSRFDRGSYALLGDISYMKGDHDVTQMNKGQIITASPDSDSISVGIKAVKDYAAGENGTLTPYVGLRYLRLSTDDFTASNGLRYEGDDQDLVIVPVGVNYTASISHGKWNVRSYAGIGYVWTAGDRSADQTVMLGTAADSFSYDTADSGSFIARAGVTTDCGDMSYGIGYSWQKGDSVSNNAWTLSASYHF